MPFATLGRSALWVSFFAVILASWWVMYDMATGMGMDLFGRMAMPMGEMGMGDMGAMSGGEMAGSGMTQSGMAGSQMSGGEMAGAGMSGAGMSGAGMAGGEAATGQMTGDGMAMDGMAMGGDMMMGGMTEMSVLIPMWMIMMAAMMGPTFVYATLTYGDLIKTGAGSRVGQAGLVLGFLIAWFAFGAIMGVVHAQFVTMGWLDVMGASSSAIFSAILLVIAGIYQFTPLKDRCAAHCRSPMVHFLAHWRSGFAGGLRMGARDGAFCIGCCWAIMALGFVGGAMNLVWMGIATLIMTLEKLPDLGRWMTRPLGVAFCAAGVALAATSL
ncbi:MAG: DUF2182 domain-containing protein [Pseudomonadota bacterium]